MSVVKMSDIDSGLNFCWGPLPPPSLAPSPVSQDIVQQLQRTLHESGINTANVKAQRNNGNLSLLMALVSGWVRG